MSKWLNKFKCTKVSQEVLRKLNSFWFWLNRWIEIPKLGLQRTSVCSSTSVWQTFIEFCSSPNLLSAFFKDYNLIPFRSSSWKESNVFLNLKKSLVFRVRNLMDLTKIPRLVSGFNLRPRTFWRASLTNRNLRFTCVMFTGVTVANFIYNKNVYRTALSY